MPPRAHDSIDLELEREIDRLFRLPLDEFVDARNHLAVELRKAGRADEGARVKELSKPSVTAWAVNQVWWTDRRTFEQMLDAGERLRTQQRASLKGKVVNLREAVEVRQEKIAAVLELAVRAMGGLDRVSAPMQQRIAATCDVLAAGDVPPDTVLGRLAQDLQPAGFSALSSLLPGAASDPGASPRDGRGVRRPADIAVFTPRNQEPAHGSRTYAKAPRVVDVESARQKEQAAARARSAAIAEARNAVSRAEAALRDAERELKQRRAAQEDADRAFDAAQEHATDLERRVADARRQESAARAALNDAKRQASAAETTRERAAHALGKARSQLDALT